jgi:hypothetical protein
MRLKTAFVCISIEAWGWAVKFFVRPRLGDAAKRGVRALCSEKRFAYEASKLSLPNLARYCETSIMGGRSYCSR